MKQDTATKIGLASMYLVISGILGFLIMGEYPIIQVVCLGIAGGTLFFDGFFALYCIRTWAYEERVKHFIQRGEWK